MDFLSRLLRKSPAKDMFASIVGQETDHGNSSGAQTPDPTLNKDPLGVEHQSVPSQHLKNNKISDDSSDSSLDYGSANEDSPPQDDSLVLAFANVGLNTPKTDRSNDNSQTYLTPNQSARNGPSGDLKLPTEEFSSSENVYYSQESSQVDVLPLRKQKIFNVLTKSFDTPDLSFQDDLSNNENCEVGEDPLNATITYDPLHVSHTAIQEYSITGEKSSVEPLETSTSQKDSIFHLSLVENNSNSGDINDKLVPENFTDSFSADNDFESQADGIAVISSDEQQEILEVLDNLVNNSVSKSPAGGKVVKDTTFNRSADWESESNSESLNVYIQEEKLANNTLSGEKFTCPPDIVADIFDEDNPHKERRDSGASIFVIDSEFGPSAMNQFVKNQNDRSIVINSDNIITVAHEDIRVSNANTSISDVTCDNKIEVVNTVAADTVVLENSNENIDNTPNVLNVSSELVLTTNEQVKELVLTLEDNNIPTNGDNLNDSNPSYVEGCELVSEEINLNNTIPREITQNNTANDSNEICFTNSDASSVIENLESGEYSSHNVSDIQPDENINETFISDLKVSNTTFEIIDDAKLDGNNQDPVANTEDITSLKEAEVNLCQSSVENAPLMTSASDVSVEISQPINLPSESVINATSEIIISGVELDIPIFEPKAEGLPILQSTTENNTDINNSFIEEPLNKCVLSEVNASNVSSQSNDNHVDQNFKVTEDSPVNKFQDILPNDNFIKSQIDIVAVVPECLETVINTIDTIEKDDGAPSESISTIAEITTSNTDDLKNHIEPTVVSEPSNTFIQDNNLPVEATVDQPDLNLTYESRVSENLQKSLEEETVISTPSLDNLQSENILSITVTNDVELGHIPIELMPKDNNLPVEATVQQPNLNKTYESPESENLQKPHEEETILSTPSLDDVPSESISNITVTKDIESDHIPAELMPKEVDRNFNVTITKDEESFVVAQTVNSANNDSALVSNDAKPVEVHHNIPEDVIVAEVNLTIENQVPSSVTLPKEVCDIENNAKDIVAPLCQVIEDQIIQQNLNVIHASDAIVNIDLSEPMECDDIELNLSNDECMMKSVHEIHLTDSNIVAPSIVTPYTLPSSLENPTLLEQPKLLSSSQGDIKQNDIPEPMECEEYEHTYDDIVKEAQHELEILLGTEESSVVSVAQPLSAINPFATNSRIVNTPERDLIVSTTKILSTTKHPADAEIEQPKLLENTFSQTPILQNTENVSNLEKSENIITVDVLKEMLHDNISDLSDSLETDSISSLNNPSVSDIDQFESKSNMELAKEQELDSTLTNSQVPEINSNYTLDYQIDDLNINPFATKSKMANSLDRELGNTANPVHSGAKEEVTGYSTSTEINANTQDHMKEMNQTRILQTPEREENLKNDLNLKNIQSVKESAKRNKIDLNTTCVIDEKDSNDMNQPKEVQPELPKNTLNDKAPFASPRPQERRVNQLTAKRRISDKMSKSQNLSPMSKCGDLMGLSPVANSGNSTHIQDIPDPADLLTGRRLSDGFYPLHDFGDDDFKTPGEMFKDPAAFDFLLHCGEGGASSGRDFCKESLLVKFDPLVGGPKGALPSGVRPDRTTRPATPPPACVSPKLDEDASSASGLAESCSSDSSLCTYNSEPGKTLSTMSSVEQSLGALSLQTQGNQPQHIASNNSIPAHSVGANINVINQPTEKPTQVVTPAISTRQQYLPSTPLSSKSVSVTPKSASVSSAIAAIDRLISFGANTPPPPPVVVQPKEAEMDPRLLNELQSVREMLGRQEEELRQAHEAAAALQKQLSESATREQTLIDRVNEKNRDHRKMDTVMEEYERTISQFFGEREQEKRQWAEEKSSLVRERDEANSHLGNMEHSFNDIHAKYERCKTMIQGYKTNEEILKQTVITNEEASKKQLERYEQLRQHAMTQLEIANQEIDTVKRASQSEILKLQAMLKKSEIQMSSLQESLNQKTKDVEDLTAICDELINKVG